MRKIYLQDHLITDKAREVFLDITGITQSVILTGQLSDAISLGYNYDYGVTNLDFIIENKDTFLFLKQHLNGYEKKRHGNYNIVLGTSTVYLFKIKGVLVRFHLYKDDNHYYNRNTEIVDLFGHTTKIISTQERYLFHQECINLLEDGEIKDYHNKSLLNYVKCFDKFDLKLSIGHRLALTQVFELIDLQNIIIVGSLADYINLRGFVDIKVGDIDFIIFGEDSLIEFSKYYDLIFAEKPMYNNLVNHKQFYTFINGIKLDFFVVEYKEEFNDVDFNINPLMGKNVKSNSISEALKVHELSMKKFKEEVPNNYLMTKHSRRLGLYNHLTNG